MWRDAEVDGESLLTEGRCALHDDDVEPEVGEPVGDGRSGDARAGRHRLPVRLAGVAAHGGIRQSATSPVRRAA